MRKTLLLVFIHGFKGGDDTFGTFPEHLKALLAHALPKTTVLAITYPQYETRGELQECVARFREWLENKVIDLEVANETPSPTVDPSVHIILVGHSMGGIVAAETLLLLASEKPIPTQASSANPDAPNFASNATLSSTTGTSHPQPPPPSVESEALSFMFPHIQGLLAFDTPFLGLAPGMVAHGLEGGHKMASNAVQTYNEVASVFGWGGKTGSTQAGGGAVAAAPKAAPVGALPAPSTAADAAAAPKWQSWGKYAMFAGAAGAVAAGGAAALYSQREKISAGWTWASSHLLFVGDLAKAERLRKRVENVNKLCIERGVGAANLYTNLGKGAREGYGWTSSVAGSERTFCNLPAAVKEGRQKDSSETSRMRWVKAINDKAKDEANAHMMMFYPKDNPGFYMLGEAAKELICAWVDQGWYLGSTGEANGGTMLGDAPDSEKFANDWEGLDGTQERDDSEEDLQMRDEEHDTDDVMNGGEESIETSVIVDKSPTSSMTMEAQAAAAAAAAKADAALSQSANQHS